MANLEVIRRLIIRAETQGMEQAAGQLRKVADAQGDLASAAIAAATATDTSSNRVLSARSAFESLERSLIPAAREMHNVERQMRTLFAAAAQGIDPTRINAVFEAAIANTREVRAETERLMALEKERAAQNAAHAQAGIAAHFSIGGPRAVDRGATLSALEEEMRRLEVEERRQEEIQRLRGEAIGQAFTQGLNESFRIGARAIDMGATTSALAEEMERLEELAKARAAHLATVSQQNIRELTGQNRPAAVTRGATYSALSEHAQEQEQMARQANMLLEQIDPLGQAQKRFNTELAQYSRLAEQGHITTRQLADAHALARQKFDIVARGLGQDGLAGNLRLASHQWMNFGQQMNDVVTMLASGSSPFQVLATQGGQIYQVLAGARGGLRGGLAAVKDALLSAITPARVFGGALAGGAIAAAVAYARFLGTYAQVNAAVTGLGRNLGVTTGRFIALSEDWARANKLSVSQTIDLGTTLARTGRIGTENIGRMTALAKDLAVTMGTDLEGAGEILANAFGRGAEGIDELNRKLLFLDARTQAVIESLFRQGRAQEAIALAVEKLPAGLAKAEEGSNKIVSAWTMLKNQISDADHALGGWINRLISGPDPAERLRQATKAVEDFKRVTAPPPEVTPGGAVFRAPVRIGNRGAIAPSGPAAQANAAEELRLVQARTQAEQELQAALERTAQAMRQQELNKQSQELQALIDEVPRAGDSYRKLKNQLDAFNKAMATPGLKEHVRSIQEFEDAGSELRQAIKSLEDENGRLMESDQRAQRLREIDIKLIGEQNAATRAALEMERQRLQQAGQRITEEEAANQVQHAGTQILEQRRHALSEDLRTRDEQIRQLGLYGREQEVANQLMQVEQQYRSSGMALSQQELRQFEERIRLQMQLQDIQQHLNRLYQEFIRPGEELNAVIEAANRLFAAGAINTNQYAEAVLDAQLRTAQAQRTWAGGMEAGLLQVQRQFGDVSGMMESFITGTANDLASTLTDIAMGTVSAEEGFQNLAASVAASLMEMAIKVTVILPLVKALQQALGGIGGIGGGPAGIPTMAQGGFGPDIPVSQFHKGGMVGIDGQRRYVHPAYFDDAPRLHNGTLKPDERAAILQTGEHVLSRDDVAAIRNGGGTKVVNNVQVIAPPGSNVRREERRNASGGTDLKVVIDQMQAQNLATPGSASNRAMRTTFGAQPALTRR